MRLNDARKALREGKGKLRCSEVVEILEGLGFEVRDGRRGGHQVVFHLDLPNFHSASFNCGHGKNPEIKPSYVTNLLRILDLHEAAILAYLNEGTSQ